MAALPPQPDPAPPPLQLLTEQRWECRHCNARPVCWGLVPMHLELDERGLKYVRCPGFMGVGK